MIHRVVYHNDRLVPIEQVRFSPGQAGLLNGWGIFTTLRIVKGEAFAYERHWRRLEKDASRISLPFPFNAAKVRVHLRDLLRANEVTEGSARIYVVYNQTGFWQSDEKLPPVDLLLYSAGLPEYREPARLTLREHGRHAASPLAGVKAISWLNNVWTLAESRKSGFDEALCLNERGEVAECTAANIFCVRGDKVFTPPLNSGCLEGVTRQVLLEIGPEAGIAFVEQALHPEDFYAADEVFISSTNRNLLSVGEIEGHRIPAAPGKVTKKLEAIFSAYVADYVSRRTSAPAGVPSHT
jgi:branched-chain amino acid aminotransferase